MWRPGNHQNAPKRDFCIILQIVQDFCGTLLNLRKLKETNEVDRFEVFGVQAAQMVILSKEFIWFREGSRNPENLVPITFFHSKTGFAAPGPQQIVAERYVYVGFLGRGRLCRFWEPQTRFQ